MRFTQGRRRAAPSIIIVSLIDVLLVVLIFLMVTTTFRNTPSVKLVLPEARKAERPGASRDRLVVTISTSEPHLYLDTEPITFERLGEEFASAYARDTNLAVSIRSDRGAAVGEVVRVMDAARGTGFRTVDLVVNTPGGAGGGASD